MRLGGQESSEFRGGCKKSAFSGLFVFDDEGGLALNGVRSCVLTSATLCLERWLSGRKHIFAKDA